MLPESLWTMFLVGQYLRPNGQPHQGFVTLTPDLPSNRTAITATQSGTPLTITLQAARLDFDEEGNVSSELLNPNDPTITPGPATGNPWGYLVRETFFGGPVLDWTLGVSTEVTDGGLVDLAKATRLNEEVVRPVDWFPRHLTDTSVQASRISPRGGHLLRGL